MKLSKIKFLLALALIITFFSTENTSQAQSFRRQLLPAISPGAPLPSDRFIKLSSLVNPAVVNISTQEVVKTGNKPNPNDPFYNFLKPYMTPQQQQPTNGLGTGFIIRKDGLIITNNHVIEKADVIKVQLSEGDETLYDAEVIGADKPTDIALIKIKSKKSLPTIQLGTSKDVKVGQWVAAFGNPFGHGHSMSKGIISAKGRELDELNRLPFLQTDASINPGNSGGPLVNLRGEVIGVNTAVDARAQGIGFAIPIDSVKTIISKLEKDGYIEKAFLGVGLADINFQIQQALKLKTKEGALVQHVHENTSALKAGIQIYDVITKADSKKIASAYDLIRYIQNKSAGDKIKLEILRNSSRKNINVTLGIHPDDKNKRPVKRKAKVDNRNKGLATHAGFKVSDAYSSFRRQFNLPKLKVKRPLVTEVTPGSAASRAGLAPGDILLDVNRKEVRTAADVKAYLRRDFNLIRVQRGQATPFLIYITKN